MSGGENYRQREEQVQRPWGGCDMPEDQQGGLCGQSQMKEGERSGDDRAKNMQGCVGCGWGLACTLSRTEQGRALDRDRSRLRSSQAPSGGEVGNSSSQRGQK